MKEKSTLRLPLKILGSIFYGTIVITLLIVSLYETGVLQQGAYADSPERFWPEFVMEFLTIACIPLALKLFSLQKIKLQLATQKERALLKWGTIRMLMLCLPLIANTLLYYIFLGVAFGYLAIVLFISLAFVTPTKSRCYDEIENN